ncbi:MAG: hypothetical protein A2168_08865 [Planctomycetes bacterium RBG_13_50_24]|nr:MAG: hypothetical protein A2168_08865 [Planctomycetes bacterium RBG_13_50_24]
MIDARKEYPVNCISFYTEGFMKKKLSNYKRKIFLYISGVLIMFSGLAHADNVTMNARITHEISNEFYVDKGTDQGLRQGLSGSLRFDDGRILEFEVIQVTRKLAMLRFAGHSDKQDGLIGQSVELVFERKEPDQQNKDEKSPKNPPATADDDRFVPLLAPPQWTLGLPEARNIFHGQMQARQSLQTDRENQRDYSVTHFGSSGSLDRIEGSNWSFEWSGDLAYRDGDAYRYHPDYQEPRLDLYMGSFQRPLADDGFLRLGRFLPRELPGIGYVDGIQGQIRHDEHISLGAVAGFKPNRYNLDPSEDEPLLAGYATYETGKFPGPYYSGTAGILSSLYEGQSDRLALLFDQRASLGPLFTLYSTAEVDFDAGAAQINTGTNLARLDVSAVSRLSSELSFSAGLDHWQRPDTRAERDLLPYYDERFFDDGYWRYWVGSNQGLPWNFRLSEEVSFINSDTYDYDPRWQIGLTHTDLFDWQGASVTATVYNIAVVGMDGYGGRLSAYLPLWSHKLSINPLAGFRTVDVEPRSREFELTYLSMRLNGRLSHNWSLFGGFTHSYGDRVDSTLLDLGIRYRW